MTTKQSNHSVNSEDSSNIPPEIKMTDSAFTKLLRRAAAARNKSLELVSLAEAEYDRRYGKNPSDADDDAWIDSMSGSNGMCNESITAADVEKGAIEYAGLTRIAK